VAEGGRIETDGGYSRLRMQLVLELQRAGYTRPDSWHGACTSILGRPVEAIGDLGPGDMRAVRDSLAEGNAAP
jgi:hypothetical protein